MSKKQWRCFHCDELFKTYNTARDHFGDNQLEEPACQIKSGEGGLVRRIRELQFELAKFYTENTEIDKYVARLNSDHYRELRREEEKGYERGMRDMRKELEDAQASR